MERVMTNADIAERIAGLRETADSEVRRGHLPMAAEVIRGAIRLTRQVALGELSKRGYRAHVVLVGHLDRTLAAYERGVA